MEFVVETGEGVEGATAYFDEAFLWAYVAATGAEVGYEDPKAAIIRGSRWLDAEFGNRYPGERVKGRNQGREWPRIGATDAEGNAVPSDVVPVEILHAAAEATIRETYAVGALSPDAVAGPAVKRERKKLGSMETEKEYAIADGGRPAAPAFPVINGILAPLIGETDAFGATWYWR